MLITIETLGHVFDGELDPKNKRHLRAALPLFEKYLEHRQTDVVEAMFEEALQQASEISRKHMRDVYWNLLHKIGSAHKAFALSELEAPRFRPHTEKELEQRKNEREAAQKNATQSDLLCERHSSMNRYYLLKDIATSQIRKTGDRELALRAATLISSKYTRELKRDINSRYSRHSGTLLGIEASYAHRYLADKDERPVMERLKASIALADEVDAVLGISGTRDEFAKAFFTKALLDDTDPAVRDFILQEADRLSPQQKMFIVREYSYLHVESDGQDKSLCGTLSTRFNSPLLYTGDTALYDRYIAILKKWSAMHKGHDFVGEALAIGHLDHYDHEHMREKGVYRPAVNNDHYDPELSWAEVTRRLEMRREATKNFPKMKAFTLEENEYLDLAFERALKFGHAKDLEALFDYCAGLSPEQQAARNFKHGLPHRFPSMGFNGLISRDAETLKVLTERMPVGIWLADRGYEGTYLTCLLTVMEDGSDLFKLHEKKTSYVAKGKPMTYADITRGQSVLFDFIQRIYPTLSDERKERVKQELCDEGDYTPFRQSARTLLYSGDPDAAGNWVRTWYAILPAKQALSRTKYETYHITDKAVAVGHLPALAGYFTALRECDADKEVWRELLEINHFRSAQPQTIYVTDKLAPEHSPALAETQAGRIARRFLEKAKTQSGSLTELYDKCAKEEGAPDHRYPEHKNYNPQLFHALFRYFHYYDKVEQSMEATSRCHRLAHLFETVRQVDTFLRRHIQPTRRPVHDLCEFQIDTQGHWDKRAWGNLAIRYGAPILRVLPLASKIEDAITTRKAQGEDIDLARLKPTDIRKIAATVGYKREAENPALAVYCIDYGVSEQHYNETLDLVGHFKTAAAPACALPSIAIDGKSVGLPGYRFERVPAGDPLNLWIGKHVNCCNHLAGDGADMARKQFSGAANALYVIRDKRERPVAKLSGWLSQKGNVVFNAWERLSDEEDFLLVRFTLSASLKMLEENPAVNRVMMGTGPLNPKALPFQIAANAEMPQEDVGRTSDSRNQFLLAERSDIGVAQEILDEEIRRNAKRGSVKIKLTYREMRDMGLL